MTLKVYNVRKLHGPRILDGFLDDSVDTTLARVYILYNSCTTAAEFSELHD